MGRVRAGAAKVNITPPIGVGLTGYAARDGNSTGVHDELYAAALVLDDGENRVAIVTSDVLAIGNETDRAVRALVQQQTGIPEANVLLSASHTHSGPATIFLRYCGEIHPPYLRVLERKLAGVVQMAVADLGEAGFGAAVGAASIGYNRREARLPARGTVDDTVGVLRVDSASGRLATLINYACHPVVLGADNLLISADYPGPARAVVEAARGGVALFANGACGDINPVARGSFENVRRMGAILGAEALSVAEGLELADEARIRVAFDSVDLPLQPLPPAEELRQIVAENRKQYLELRDADATYPQWNVPRAMMDWAEACLRLVESGNVPASLPLQVQVIAINDVVLVALSGEPLVEIGLTIKQRISAEHVFVIGYANGIIGYIPTARAFERGGYEVVHAPRWYGTSSLTPETEQIVLDTVDRLRLAVS